MCNHTVLGRNFWSTLCVQTNHFSRNTQNITTKRIINESQACFLCDFLWWFTDVESARENCIRNVVLSNQVQSKRSYQLNLSISYESYALWLIYRQTNSLALSQCTVIPEVVSSEPSLQKMLLWNEPNVPDDYTQWTLTFLFSDQMSSACQMHRSDFSIAGPESGEHSVSSLSSAASRLVFCCCFFSDFKKVENKRGLVPNYYMY